MSCILYSFLSFLADRNGNKKFSSINHDKAEHVGFTPFPLMLCVHIRVYLLLKLSHKTFLKSRLYIYVNKFTPWKTDQLTSHISLLSTQEARQQALVFIEEFSVSN